MSLDNYPTPPDDIREYLWPNSLLLFVQSRLPVLGDGQYIFGRSARRVWQALFDAGLVTKRFDDPVEAERTVFGKRLHTASGAPFSIVTVRWDSGMNIQSRRLWLGNGQRVYDLAGQLNARKVVYMGKKTALEATRYWLPPEKKAQPFGFLRHYDFGGVRVPEYGLPMRTVGPGSAPYFEALRETGDTIGTVRSSVKSNENAI